MPVPVIIFGLLGGMFGYAVGRRSASDAPLAEQRQLPAPVKTSGRLALPSPPEPEEVSWIEELESRLSGGAPIPRKLVLLALREADEMGDEKTFRAIAVLFSKKKETKSKEAGKAEGGELKESPIENIPSDAWADFVSKLRSQKPDFKTDRHIGCYEHSRQRLKQLGIADPTTEDAQYDALAKDIADHYESSKPLIDEFSGDAVTLEGKEHPITMSGILALLKSGGAKGAEQWLRQPDNRSKYPRQSELFLRANGCF